MDYEVDRCAKTPYLGGVLAFLLVEGNVEPILVGSNP